MNFFAVCKYCLYLQPSLLGAIAGVVELVDTLDLGSSAARCESSSLSACTTQNLNIYIFRCLRFFNILIFANILLLEYFNVLFLKKQSCFLDLCCK